MRDSVYKFLQTWTCDLASQNSFKWSWNILFKNQQNHCDNQTRKIDVTNEINLTNFSPTVSSKKDILNRQIILVMQRHMLLTHRQVMPPELIVQAIVKNIALSL